MASIDRPTAGGNSGPIALRPEVAPMPEPASGRLGYSFDPIPRRIRENPRLKPIDRDVVAILIGFAVWRRDSCWAAVSGIASRLPAMRKGRSGSPSACDRTVQRSIDRLKAEGEIRHERVAKPDPDDPRNRTGWRFYFNWIAPPADPGRPPREVTKGPGEVTKRGGEVTKESGDSLVTQERLEVLEQDSTTFNVAALAPGGEEAPGPASIPTNRLPGPDASSLEATPATADRPPTEAEDSWFRARRGYDAPGLAVKLRSLLLDYRVVLRLGDGDVVAWEPYAGFRAFPPEAAYWMARLGPHLLAMLRPRAEPEATASEGSPDAGPAPASKVRDAAKVRAMIGALPGNPDPAAEMATARAIAAAIGDLKPKSLETFGWYASEVRRSGMPLDWLVTAFERACSRKARNRGKVLVGTIQRLKDQDPGRAGGRGRPPAGGRP